MREWGLKYGICNGIRNGIQKLIGKSSDELGLDRLDDPGMGRRFGSLPDFRDGRRIRDGIGMKSAAVFFLQGGAVETDRD